MRTYPNKSKLKINDFSFEVFLVSKINNSLNESLFQQHFIHIRIKKNMLSDKNLSKVPIILMGEFEKADDIAKNVRDLLN